MGGTDWKKRFGLGHIVILLQLYHTSWLTNRIGEICLAHDILSGEDVAIKLQPIGGKHRTLEHESYVYRKLNGRTGIPCIHWFGTENGYDIMVINRLGRSLEDLFICCRFRFSVGTVLLLASQLASVCFVALQGPQLILSRSVAYSWSTLTTLFTKISNLAILLWVLANTLMLFTSLILVCQRSSEILVHTNTFHSTTQSASLERLHSPLFIAT